MFGPSLLAQYATQASDRGRRGRGVLGGYESEVPAHGRLYQSRERLLLLPAAAGARSVHRERARDQRRSVALHAHAAGRRQAPGRGKARRARRMPARRADHHPQYDRVARHGHQRIRLEAGRRSGHGEPGLRRDARHVQAAGAALWHAEPIRRHSDGPEVGR